MQRLLNFICIGIALVILGCSNLSNYPSLNAPTKDGFVTIDGGKLYYQIIGAEGDPVIVIHGGPGMDQGYFITRHGCFIC